MSERNDGGPAFPEATDEWDHNSERYRPASFGGMTLRDYFAGRALTGLMSNRRLSDDATNAAVAEVAYSLAAAMLKAREA